MNKIKPIYSKIKYCMTFAFLSLLTPSFINQSAFCQEEKKGICMDRLESLKNHSGPLHYLGNRNLSLPNYDGRMHIDGTWLEEHFSILLENLKGKKFKKCIEPFCGCASWSLAAMELGIGEEYIINDSDQALVNTLRLMRDDPKRIKAVYASAIENYRKARSKKEFFQQVIKDYNKADLEKKSLLLPFIINHSWSGIVFHDNQGNIVYKDANVHGKSMPGYLEEATLSLEEYVDEVDRVSKLLKSNKVVFKSGDFLDALKKVQPGDFVALNPPYPENTKARSGDTGMYRELYHRDTLHKNLVNIMQFLENQGVAYYMTYGFHDPKLQQYVIRDNSNRLRHFFRILGYKDCAFGIGLDQMYFSSKLSIPPTSTIIPAKDVLQDQQLTPEEALANFNKIAQSRKS